jgi:uncharacterized tellurite resistance protein B-like protein
MGLFDIFKKQANEDMDPIKAVTISMFYIMGADGEMQSEEVGHLLSMLGGKEVNGQIQVGGQYPGLMKSVKEYVKSVKVEDFIKASNSILTDSMKMYILINQINSALSNGESGSEEQEMIFKFMEGWGIDSERVKPIFQMIEFMNDRSVFLDINNPKNKEGFVFNVKI